MAAAAADVPEMDVVAGEHVGVAPPQAPDPVACVTWLIDSLAGHIVLLEDQLAHGLQREYKLRERLHSSDFILNEFKDLYFQVRQEYEKVSEELAEMRKECVCHGGFHGGRFRSQPR